jgi:hypothetical protein
MIALFIGATFAGSASADESLFAVQYSVATPLYEVDQTNGSIAAVGPVDLDNIGDLTSDPATGRVWGMKIDTNQLVTFNPTTGAAALGPALDSTDDMVSIAFDPLTDTLYGNTAVGFDVSADELFTINPDTGQTTSVGLIGFDAVYGLAFDQNGQLFGTTNDSELISINTGSGAGNLIDDLPAGSYFDLASRPSDNTMFVAESFGNDFYTLNTANGDLTTVGPYGSSTNIVGLAFIPEPASVALIGLGGLSLLRRRR